MKLREVKLLIGNNKVENFPQIVGNMGDEKLKKILFALTGNVPFNDKYRNIKLIQFLYSIYVHSDRWSAPSPFIITDDIKLIFFKSIELFILVEGGLTVNSKVMKLKLLLEKILENFDSLPFSNVNSGLLKKIEDEYLSVPTPSESPDKMREFNEQAEKLYLTINGLRHGKFITKICYMLPYVLTDNRLSINTNWNGIPVKITLTPEFLHNRESFVQAGEGCAIQSMGPSRWQCGISHISIEFSSLVDMEKYTESLQAIAEKDTPVKGWPKSFAVAFEFSERLYWHLKGLKKLESRWIPSPKDISEVEIETLVRDTENHRITYKKQGSPANLMKLFTPSDSVEEFEIQELVDIPWFQKCKALSIMYLEMGDTNEAIFWLNVGIESLFKDRFSEIAKAAQEPSLETDLNSPKAFWAEAIEIVKAQYPDVADRIVWPTKDIHVSIYQKIKYLTSKITLKADYKSIRNKYSKISRYRNSLFHGSLDKRIEPEKVVEALMSYDWLIENFSIC